MSFVETLEQGRFLLTTEEPMPRGSDLSTLLARSRRLIGVVDGINLTEASAAVMAMSPIGAVPALIEQGHSPLLHFICRDRNRIALQADVLAAAALGATTVVCMAGDPIEAGNQPGATAVDDLDTAGLLRALARLSEGVDMTGHALHGTPALCLGAVVNPGAEDVEHELAMMELKAEAGARFFQTQAVYDPPAFERFMARADRFGVPVIAGFIVPRSAEMARRMNRSVPGVRVPEEMIARLDGATDKVRCAIELSAPVLRHLAHIAQGLHVIAVGWEEHLPALLTAAGVERGVS
jgi:5,10-methylenetetrahydrofolate reductase